MYAYKQKSKCVAIKIMCLMSMSQGAQTFLSTLGELKLAFRRIQK